MRKKPVLYIILLFLLLAVVYWLFFPKKPIPQPKLIILLERPFLTGNDHEFIIKDSDSTQLIIDPVKLDFLGKMRQIRGLNIVKTKRLAKIITTNQDTINVVISLPGCYFTDLRSNKTYGFTDSQKQQKAFSFIFENK